MGDSILLYSTGQHQQKNLYHDTNNKGIRIDVVTTMKMEILDLRHRIERQSKIITDQKEEILKYKNLIQNQKTSFLHSNAQRNSPQKTSNIFVKHIRHQSLIEDCFKKDLIIPILKLPELPGKVSNQLLEDFDSKKSNPNPTHGQTQIHNQEQELFSISNVNTMKYQGSQIDIEVQSSEIKEEFINENLITSTSDENDTDYSDYSQIFIENEMENEDSQVQVDQEMTTKTFKCEYCEDKVFSSIKQVNIHARNDHKELKDIQCSICGEVCPTFHIYVIHMNIHWEKFKCSFCGKLFGKQHLLNRHIAYCHNLKKEQKCDQCGQVFVNLGSLVRHIKYIHQKTETFHCSQCPRTFSRRDYLKPHEEIHNAHKTSLKCSNCHKIFNTSTRLWHHNYLVHRKNKPPPRKNKPNKASNNDDGNGNKSESKAKRKIESKSKCPYDNCNRSSSNKFQLKLHILRIHQRDKSRDFKSNFEASQKTSTTIANCNQRQSTTEDCSKKGNQIEMDEMDVENENLTFSNENDNDSSPMFIENEMQNEDLQVQVDKKMTRKTFKCEYCDDDKVFSSIKQVNIHARNDHKKLKDIQCSTCGEVCPTFNIYEKHMNIHWEKFKCKFCGKFFGKKNSLEYHIATCHNVNKKQCDQCGKVFVNRGSLITHIKYVHQKTFRPSKKLNDGNKSKSKDKVRTTRKPRIIQKIGIGLKCPYDSCNNRYFALKIQLDRHTLRIHQRNKSRDFKCNFEGCEWRFLTTAELRTHSRVHLSFEERAAMKLKTEDYICSLCGASLRSLGGYQKHLKNHKNENNTGEFACDFEGCWRKFENLFSLKVHKRHHFTQNPKMYNTSEILSKKMLEKRKKAEKVIEN